MPTATLIKLLILAALVAAITLQWLDFGEQIERSDRQFRLEIEQR